MTTAKKLPSGSWRCVVYLGKDNKGKKIQKSITCPTRIMAELEAQRYLQKYLEITRKMRDSYE